MEPSRWIIKVQACDFSLFHFIIVFLMDWLSSKRWYPRRGQEIKERRRAPLLAGPRFHSAGLYRSAICPWSSKNGLECGQTRCVAALCTLVAHIGCTVAHHLTSWSGAQQRDRSLMNIVVISESWLDSGDDMLSSSSTCMLRFQVQ